LVWAASMMPGPQTLVFHYLGLFGCGLACFHRSRGWLGPVGFLATVAAMSAAFWYVDNGLSALVAAGTALTIAWVAVGSRVGTWLGGISYSLYLTHLLIGGRIVNAGVRFAHTLPVQGLLLAAALAASIAAAAVFSWLVEQPAQRWSAAIRYRGQAGAGAVR
jgi:peptidoglycan/LPS O-acetylase OafA/YrhL